MNNILIAIFVLLLPSIASGQPAIEFMTETHDFGKIPQGGQLEYSFEFTNKGRDELVINSLAAS